MLQQCYSVYRKGLRDPISYRPVGLTSVPGNILRIILSNIKRHLKEYHDYQAQVNMCSQRPSHV